MNSSARSVPARTVKGKARVHAHLARDKKLKPARLKVQKMEQLPTQIITLIGMMSFNSEKDRAELAAVNKQFYTALKGEVKVRDYSTMKCFTRYIKYFDGYDRIMKTTGVTIDNDGMRIYNESITSGRCSDQRLMYVIYCD